MKFGRSPPSAATGKPHGFFELAKAHVAIHGGEWFVVERKNPAQAQQWRAWIAYFAWLDDQTTPKGRKAATFRMLEKLTVPAEWPLDFDASAPPAPLPEPRQEPISPERRKQLADMLRGIVAGHQLREQRGAPTWRNMTAPQAEDRLTKLADEYAAPPQVATPGMAAYIASMRAPEAEEERDASVF